MGKRYSNEEKLYDKLVHNENYIFIHDDPSRGFIIPEKFISKEFQIIKNSYEYSIFDYSKIIENAKEINSRKLKINNTTFWIYL